MTSRRERADRKKSSIPMLLAKARQNPRGVARGQSVYADVNELLAGSRRMLEAGPEADDGLPWNDAYTWHPGDPVL